MFLGKIKMFFKETKNVFQKKQKDFRENKKDISRNQKDFRTNKKTFGGNKKDFKEKQKDSIGKEKDFKEKQNERTIHENERRIFSTVGIFCSLATAVVFSTDFEAMASPTAESNSYSKKLRRFYYHCLNNSNQRVANSGQHCKYQTFTNYQSYLNP